MLSPADLDAQIHSVAVHLANAATREHSEGHSARYEGSTLAARRSERDTSVTALSDALQALLAYRAAYHQPAPAP